MNCVVGPSVALLIQGTKPALQGEDGFVYHPKRFLITSLALPVVLQAIEARAAPPHLRVVLQFDQRIIAGLVMKARMALPSAGAPTFRGMVLRETTARLLELILRLVRLLDDRGAIAVISPLIGNETSYRLPTAAHDAQLRQTACAGSQNRPFGRGVEWLKRHFTEPFELRT